jgi:DNA polymerase III sliding clamp (beta) subunit (PCNA family)
MKFVCESGSLQKAIALVEKAISNRTPLAVMENIFLELNGSELIMRGNDL